MSTSALRRGITQQCWNCAHAASGKAKRKSLVGQTFGELTVLEMIYDISKSGKHVTYCKCQCSCGNTTITSRDLLLTKGLHSCGCAKRKAMQSLSTDVIGKNFGRLTVLAEDATTTPHMLTCLCECGNIITERKSQITTCKTQSCGCYKLDRTSEISTKDWSGYVSPYGVVALRQAYKNQKGQWMWEYQCPECSNSFVALPAHVASGHTTSCGCRTQSSGESLIERFFIGHHVHYIKQYSFPDCKYKHILKFDFAVFKNNKLFCVIEYDGHQHFKPVEIFGGASQFEETQIRDQIKDEYCLSHNIPLYRFKYELSEKEIFFQLTNIIYP